MVNNILISNFDSMFKFSSTISIVMFIVSALFSVAVLAGIIISIVKVVKGVKNGTIKLEDLKEDGEDSEFTSCEYCGASNKNDQTTCEKCGANLRRK